MPTPQELQIDATFADSMSRLSEDQLFVVLDDYKALLCIAAQHRDPKAVRWLERRVDLITDAYGALQTWQQLPF
jgi:hypothetical protein